MEDVDLCLGNRVTGANTDGLSRFLDILDGAVRYQNAITLATTNDPRSLDKAAIRSARFDTIIHLPWPDRDAATEILRRYLRDHPERESIDFVRVGSYRIVAGYRHVAKPNGKASPRMPASTPVGAAARHAC